MCILLLASDLMAASKFAEAAKRVSRDADFALSVETFLERAATTPPTGVILDLGVTDLDLPWLVAQLRGGPNPPAIIAFAPHVQAARLDAARDAGCDQILTRGDFHRRMDEILTHFAK
jgi:DNA-binding response OmpR family regulator